MSSQIIRKIILLGAPGSGKGTLANRIVKTYGLPYILVGDLLRQQIQQRSEDSRTIKDHLNKGILIPNELILKIVTDEIEKHNDKGFLLEGYPRTLKQAEILHRQVKIDHVISLHVPADEIVNRLQNRWIHLSSGRVYHRQWKPPKVAGKDDETGEDLSQREDDKQFILHHRIDAYNKNTNPIIEFYRQLGILQEFHGCESDQIWLEMKNYLDRIFHESLKQKQIRQ